MKSTLIDRVTYGVLSIILLIWLGIPFAGGAQLPQGIEQPPSVHTLPLSLDRGSSALWQTLQKLRTRASLLMVTAHPDDEDGGMLAYEARGQGARVDLLTLNRGEGGQNVMSPDYWDALGLVRTEELLEADRYYGVKQFWTRMTDFGFSKTKEETLEKWNHDKVLYDVVRVVRMTRPLVITSVFVGGPSDGHGHHQVAGEMAQEVFEAAGNPDIFPDQIKAGLKPWTPLKVYARVPQNAISAKGIYDYANGRYVPVRFYDYVHQRWIDGPLSTSVEIPEGTYDPLLGLSFVQVAREGLGYQKTQNGGMAIPPAGPLAVPYHRYASRVPTTDHENSYFDGIDVSLSGISSLVTRGDSAFLKQGLTKIDSLVKLALQDYVAPNPGRIASILAEGLKSTDALIRAVNDSGLPEVEKYNVLFELQVKRAQFNDALIQSLGLSMRATVESETNRRRPLGEFMGAPDTFQVAIPGQVFSVKVHFANPSSQPLAIEKISLSTPSDDPWQITPEDHPAQTLAGNQVTSGRFQVTVPTDAVPTKPYFIRPSIEQPYYNILDNRYLNLSLPPYPLAAWVDFDFHGAEARMGQVVQTVHRETGRGAVMNPLVVGPPISVWISPSAGITPLGMNSFPVTATIHSNVKGAAKGRLHLDLPPGWHDSPASVDFSTTKDGEEQTLTFEVFPANARQQSYTVTAVAEYGGRSYKEGYRTVGYVGLPPYDLYRPATYRTTGVDVRTALGVNVAYVMGTGDDVPQALENLGIHVHFLTAQELATGDLHKFDVVLLGVRAYAARPDLKTNNGRLLEYVKDGGVVVVQYNTSEYDHNYGPYPYELGRDPEKVVDEEAKVQILDPQNPVFTWPNKITSKDFEGWVEERGHSFIRTWDSHFEALVETHDPGQDPQRGGLLFARYGKGVYIYGAFAFYRQLPEGVAGAYRIFANLVSLSKNPQLHRGQSSPLAGHGQVHR